MEVNNGLALRRGLTRRGRLGDGPGGRLGCSVFHDFAIPARTIYLGFACFNFGIFQLEILPVSPPEWCNQR